MIKLGMPIHEGESFAKFATLIPPEVTRDLTVDQWRDWIDDSVGDVEDLIDGVGNPNRDKDTATWLKNVSGFESVEDMQSAALVWENMSAEDRANSRETYEGLMESLSLTDQVAYLALDNLGRMDKFMSAGDFDEILPGPLKGAGEAVLANMIGSDEIRGALSSIDLVYRSTKFNNRSDVFAYIEYLKSQTLNFMTLSGSTATFWKEKQAVSVYLEQRLAGANAVLEKISRHGVEIPDTKEAQLELMRSAVRVFEALSKMPGEGLEIMDQTMIFNAFYLDSPLKGGLSTVHPEVLQEMLARVKSLGVAKILKVAGGFMPSDRAGLDVISAIEKLNGTRDCLNYDDMSFFFGGLAEKNGIPVKQLWDIRESMDFGTAYEELIKGIVANYDGVKDEAVVKKMFADYGLVETAANFKKMVFEGIYDGTTGKWLRPTEDVPFFADRGQTMSEDSNVLRKEVAKMYLGKMAQVFDKEMTEAKFAEAWGMVDLLRFATAEDIRARINLEGHNTLWEGMSGILNTLDRAGKLKPAADLWWVGQQIIQTGAPYLCYVMRHDIHTPLLAEEINPKAFLDIKTDMSYWSSWVKTTQKAADYLMSGLDEKSLGSTLKAMHDVTSKALKSAAIVNVGEDKGYVDNLKRVLGNPNEFELDDHGRRVIDKGKSAEMVRRLKELYVRQAVQGLINACYASHGDEVESIAKVAIQFRREMITSQYSDIQYSDVGAIGSVQPEYHEIADKAKRMDVAAKKVDVLAFMTPDEFGKVLGDLGFNKEILKARAVDAATAVLTGLLGVDRKK